MKEKYRKKIRSSQQKKANSALSKKEKASRRKITGWRFWLFRFVAVIFIPALLILALEFGLRLTGYGFDGKAIIKCKVKGQKAYCENIKFGWLFFPPNISRELNAFVFPSKKADNTYRIFVFGASAAQGAPDSAYSFSRILEVMLSEQYPGINFEVINTAMTAINSHVVVRIANDCAQYEPDLFVVYLGNNEVIGPYGAGTVFAPLSKHLIFIRFGIALRATRLGQLMTNLLQGTNRNIPKVWGGMGMFADKQLSADDESLQIVYKNYSRNLEAVINTAKKRKAAVILTIVGSNLKDCPPFASLHRSGLTEDEIKDFNDLYEEAIGYESAGQYAQAVEKYLDAAEIDGQFAELQFRLGRCYFLLNQYEQAGQRYIKARNLDTVRLRADTRINEIIREVAQNKSFTNVYLADAVKALEEQSPYQIPGEEFFYEHVHLNFKGNYILAKCIFEQIEKVLPGRIKNEKSSKQQVTDENRCRQLLAYSDWDKYTILQSMLNEYIVFPPFTNQLYHDEQVESLKQQISSLKDSLSEQVFSQIDVLYRRAIEKRPADWMLHWKYGKLLMDGRKDYRLAAEEYYKVLELMPRYYMTNVMLGAMWWDLGDYDKALGYFKEALKIKPTYAPAYYDIGLICQTKKMTKEAQSYYETAVRLSPEHYPSYINLGGLLAGQGKLDEAIRVCREGLSFCPDSVDLRYNLGCFLSLNGQKDEAVKEFRLVLKTDPGHKRAKRDLGKMLKESE